MKYDPSYNSQEGRFHADRITNTLHPSTIDSEEELERVLVDNYEHIFGPSAIYLPKALITTPGGYGTIPDGFAFDLSKKQWFIVEAELAKHDLWNHIAPQVAKQITAASKPESKRYLVERVVSLFREDQAVQDKFEEEGIELIEDFEKLINRNVYILLTS